MYTTLQREVSQIRVRRDLEILHDPGDEIGADRRLQLHAVKAGWDDDVEEAGHGGVVVSDEDRPAVDEIVEIQIEVSHRDRALVDDSPGEGNQPLSNC